MKTHHKLQSNAGTAGNPMLKKVFSVFASLFLVAGICSAQGNNTGYGEEKYNIESLAERVFKLEKKQDYCNVYINFNACGQFGHDPDGWFGNFKCKQLRLEIKGNITDHLYYRLRHRLNRSNDAADLDNFARATDIMMVGYRFNDHWAINAGKMTQYLGSFEFDLNTIYIHQFSDMVDNIDSPKAGVAILYNPVKNHEFVLNITNSINRSFFKEFPGTEAQGFESTRMPISVLLNWNGNMADNRFQTRWSAGFRHLAKDTWCYQFIIGQKLNLEKLQIFLDYSIEKSDVDRIGIVSAELATLLPEGWAYFRDATYNSIVARLDWQFHNKWNLFAQGMAEFSYLSKYKETVRQHYTYLGGVEFLPVKGQDLRIYASYVGDTKKYADDIPVGTFCRNRFELGLIYRLKIL